MSAKQSGFTLLELLVSVAILAVIGVASYQLLAQTISARDTTARHDASLLAMQKTMQVMQRDIEQTVARDIRDEYGDKQFALYTPEDNVIELTRLGWRNPLGELRAEIVRVRYVVEGGDLKRYYWNVLDRAQDSQAKSTTLLKDVEDFQIRILSNKTQWVSTWPTMDFDRTANTALAMPKAVEITFDVEPYGAVRRLFRVPEGPNG